MYFGMYFGKVKKSNNCEEWEIKKIWKLLVLDLLLLGIPSKSLPLKFLKYISRNHSQNIVHKECKAVMGDWSSFLKSWIYSFTNLVLDY